MDGRVSHFGPGSQYLSGEYQDDLQRYWVWNDEKKGLLADNLRPLQRDPARGTTAVKALLEKQRADFGNAVNNGRAILFCMICRPAHGTAVHCIASKDARRIEARLYAGDRTAGHLVLPEG